MTRWPITRMWTAGTDSGVLELSTAALAQYPGSALLAPAGLGKTFEIELLAETETAAGRDVRKARLADLAQTAEGLQVRLNTLSEQSTSNTAIYLDALDEVMVPVRQAGRLLADWLRNTVRPLGAAVRVSCRSAVFPESVRSALGEVYGKAGLVVANLQPLDTDAIQAVARDEGIDPRAFMEEIDRVHARAFAEQPLTLAMLTRVFRAGQGLPHIRTQLFDQGVRWLIAERADRRAEGTATSMAPQDLIDAAERLACYVMLSGRESIDLSESPADEVLGIHELSGLPGGSKKLDSEMLRELQNTALFDGDGPYRFRFSHRLFAEFLAGRRLARLLPHQTRALLASSLGSDSGVAGPLRETAAFAAMFNSDVAAWIAAADPEIVGLSDISDSTLRRKATLGLLDALRRHQLTDAQLWRDGLVLDGLEFSDAGIVIRDALTERGQDCEDLLEGAIKLAEAWKLTSVSSALADLTLDATAPLGCRHSAGQALSRFGTAGARTRLKPLIAGSPTDPDENLKGIALRCNYPQNLSTPELLEALTPVRRRLYGGAYSSFLYTLDRDGFAADGHRSMGLQWAFGVIQRDPRADSDHLFRIAKRIARAAVNELGDPLIRHRLIALLIEAAGQHAPSPLAPERDRFRAEAPAVDREAISSRPEAIRRQLLALVAQTGASREVVWRMAYDPADLVSFQDLEWLLSRGADESRPVNERVNYIELARFACTSDQTEVVNTWLRFRDHDLVRDRFPFYLFVELGSEVAHWMREEHERQRRQVVPAPIDDHKIGDRLAEALTLAATNNVRYFINVALLLTVSADGRREFQRFLQKTARWQEATDDTRQGILIAAKRLLERETREPRNAAKEPLNSIRVAYMAAVWLILDLDSQWLYSQPERWWRRWARYFVRELRPNLHDEDESAKALVLRALFAHAEDTTVGAILQLADSSDPDAARLFGDLLDMSVEVAPVKLDQRVGENLQSGATAAAVLPHAARYLLRRDPDRALEACLAQVRDSKSTDPDSASIAAAVVLLSEAPLQSWGEVSAYMQRRPDIAPRILGEYAQSERVRLRTSRETRDRDRGFSVTQVGQLVDALIQFWPFEADPVHDGAFWVGPADAARHLRDRLINWLSEQRDLEAVDALRELERRYGSRYAFLRRPRAIAERNYRLSRWAPVAPTAVARLLDSREKRLIRTDQDGLDAVVAAIQRYAWRLRHDSPSDLEDLWNRPKGGRPSPKGEERASDKVCVAIREYLRDYAVTADREVQIFRRQLSRDLGGAPGSEVDVLCRVLSVGTAQRDPIVIPIETKLAHNPEVATGMRAQLALRYMKQLGTNAGVFVVFWMAAPGSTGRHRPLWPSVSDVRRALHDQAEELRNEGLDVRVVVIDASLPTTALKQGRRGARVQKTQSEQLPRRDKRGTGTSGKSQVKSPREILPKGDRATATKNNRRKSKLTKDKLKSTRSSVRRRR